MRAIPRDAVVGLIALTVIVAVTAGGMSGALRSVLGSDDVRTVRASFADGQQLAPGRDVRIQGLEAGKVTSVTLDSGGRSATVEMEIRKDVGELYGDARAVLRFRSVLGGTFYVDLERGSPTRGPLRSPIPVGRTARQTEVDDITSVLQRGARQGLRALPREVGDALADPQAPAALFDSVATAAPALERGVGALRGEDLDRDLTRLIDRTAVTVAALDAPNGQLQRLVSGAGRTLRTTAARSSELRSTLQQGPGTMRDVDVTLTRLRGTLDLADPLLDELEAPAGQVGPTFAQLRPAVVDADRTAGRARPLLRALRPAVTSLARAARNGKPLLDEVQPSLDRLDQTILPYLAEVDPRTKKTTAVMIGGTFTGLGSGAAGQMDANGHFIRFPATVGSSNFNSLPCQVYLNNPDAEQLIACKTLKETLEQLFAYRPLSPTPGTDSGSTP